MRTISLLVVFLFTLFFHTTVIASEKYDRILQTGGFAPRIESITIKELRHSTMQKLTKVAFYIDTNFPKWSNWKLSFHYPSSDKPKVSSTSYVGPSGADRHEFVFKAARGNKPMEVGLYKLVFELDPIHQDAYGNPSAVFGRWGEKMQGKNIIEINERSYFNDRKRESSLNTRANRFIFRYEFFLQVFEKKGIYYAYLVDGRGTFITSAEKFE